MEGPHERVETRILETSYPTNPPSERRKEPEVSVSTRGGDRTRRTGHEDRRKLVMYLQRMRALVDILRKMKNEKSQYMSLDH